MGLAPGTKLGDFEILGPLGAGGMGEVYRARDPKLGREVAIKVLPEALSRDAERLTRFEREARILASLNHPGIATLYGLENDGGKHFLVMELVPGETLAARIARGPLAIDEAISIFAQIADALEAAHEKRIIHRDLKPANLMLTPEGKPKVLDFGLAKAQAADIPPQDLSQSPTFTRDATEAGVILGTAPYMSPEQAKGQVVDKRTDVWALGCCLFEALTGKPSFQGDTVSETLAKILEREPRCEALPERTPAGLLSLLKRCLRKDPRRRIHDIADVRIVLEETIEEPSSNVPTARHRRPVVPFSSA